jgi:hypothetical protein
MSYPHEKESLDILRDIDCGLHSGIPWHCIAWYASWKIAKQALPENLKPFLKKLRKAYREWSGTYSRQYLPCPFCALFSKPEALPHKCTHDCSRGKGWICHIDGIGGIYKYTASGRLCRVDWKPPFSLEWIGGKWTRIFGPQDTEFLDHYPGSFNVAPTK